MQLLFFEVVLGDRSIGDERPREAWTRDYHGGNEDDRPERDLGHSALDIYHPLGGKTRHSRKTTGT